MFCALNTEWMPSSSIKWGKKEISQLSSKQSLQLECLHARGKMYVWYWDDLRCYYFQIGDFGFVMPRLPRHIFYFFFFFLHVFVLAVTAVFNHRFACPSGRPSVPSPSHSYHSLSFKLKNVLFFCASAAAESQHERDGEAVHSGPCWRRRRSGSTHQAGQRQGVSRRTGLPPFAL